MSEITVYDGEYEYLMLTDPKFRQFVKECEGKNLCEIFVDTFVDTLPRKTSFLTQKPFDR